MSFYVFELGPTTRIGPLGTTEAFASLGPVGEEQAVRIVAALKAAGRNAGKFPKEPWNLVATHLPRIDMRGIAVLVEEPKVLPKDLPKARTISNGEGLWIHTDDLIKTFENPKFRRAIVASFKKDLATSSCACPECVGVSLAAVVTCTLTLAAGFTDLDDLEAASKPKPNDAPPPGEPMVRPSEDPAEWSAETISVPSPQLVITPSAKETAVNP